MTEFLARVKLSREEFDVCIVGAGVVGLCCAYNLVRRGMRVVIVEKSEKVAAEASANNGGATWPFNQMLNEPFMYRFIKDGIEAHKRLTNSGLRYDFRTIGCIFLFYDSAQQGKLEAQLKAARGDEGFEPLTKAQVHELEPELATEIAGGMLFPDCSHGVASRLCGELIREMRKRDTKIMTSTKVRGFKREGRAILRAATNKGGIQAQMFVIAAGPWCSSFSDDLGFGIPTIPIKGHIVSWRSEKPLISHMIWTGRAAIFPSPEGLVRAGGGMDFTGFDKTPDQRVVRLLSSSAIKNIPRLSNLRREVWAGLRPGTPDALPIIGYSPLYENLVLASGHYHEGFTTAPLTGEIVSDLITTGICDLEYLAMYRPGRFNS